MATLTTFDDALKDLFLGPIRNGIRQGCVLLWGSEGNKTQDGNVTGFKGIARSAEHIDSSGRAFYMSVKTTRNGSAGYRNEDNTLPSAQSGDYEQATEPLRYQYGRMRVTGPLLQASSTSEGAFAEAMKTEMEDLQIGLKTNTNRAAFGDGVGYLAAIRVDGLLMDTVVAVDTTINFTFGDGVTIDFVATDGTVIVPARTITAIDRTNRTITVTPALDATVSTARKIVRSSSDSTVAVPNNSQNKEIEGLDALIGTATEHTINPATSPVWQSYVHAYTSTNISDNVLQDAVDNVGFESGASVDNGGDIDYAIITTRGLRRNYANTLTGQKRFNDTTKLEGGFDVLMFNGLPIFVDDYCPLGTVYGLSIKDLCWVQGEDWKWMDRDGAVLARETDKDAYSAVLYAYHNLVVTRRNTHFKLTGLTDDVK